VNVDTLVRDSHAPDEARFAPADQPPAEQPAGRACEQCGAMMAPGQDWCLDCGTAAPGRLGRRPGMRTAATVVGLTLALVAGAVTAGYAAINGDAGRDTAKPAAASGAPVAQAPPSTPVAPPPTTSVPATPTTALPSVKPPVTATPSPAPATSQPAAPAPGSSSPTTSTPTTSTPTTSTPSKPTTPAIEPIDLGADAASLYDPYTRSTASSDPADAYDGDTTTAWKVTTAGGSQEMEVGLVVDLGKRRSIKELKLHTGTPGFRLEAYAADTAQVPPDILDTRWAHLNSKSGVAKDDTVALAQDSHKYRYVLLWVGKPPTSSKPNPTVKINELTILG
jgi:hypothetical protein